MTAEITPSPEDKPSLLGITNVKEAQEGKVFLYQQDLVINVGEANIESLRQQGIEFKDKELEVIRTIEQPTLRVWSEGQKITNWETAIDENTCVLLLPEGLASNHEEWTNSGCSFVHRFYQYFDANIRSQLGKKGKDLKLVCIAVSCPGFGGSKIKEGLFGANAEANADLVSDERYALLLDGFSKILKIRQSKPLGVVAAGHSAGAEGCLRWWQQASELSECPAVVALNPSIGLERQKIFDLAKRLTDVGGRAREASGLFGKIVSQGADVAVGKIEQQIIDRLVGIKGNSEAEKDQRENHLLELRTNRAAFLAKLTELARPDELKPEQIQQALSERTVMPLVLSGSKDVLTTRYHTNKWLELFLKSAQEKLKQIGLNLFQSSGETTATAVETYIQEKSDFVALADIPHDAVFIDSQAQDIAFGLLKRQFEPQLAARLPVIAEIRDIITMLAEYRIPVESRLKYVPESSLIGFAGELYKKALAEPNPDEALAKLIYESGRPETDESGIGGELMAAMKYSQAGAPDEAIEEVSGIEGASRIKEYYDKFGYTSFSYRLRQAEALCRFLQINNLVAGWQEKADNWRDPLNVEDIIMPDEEKERLSDLLTKSYCFGAYLKSRGINSLFDEINDTFDALSDLFYANVTPFSWVDNWLKVNGIYKIRQIDNFKSAFSRLILSLYEGKLKRNSFDESVKELLNVGYQDWLEMVRQEGGLTIDIPISLGDLSLLQSMALEKQAAQPYLSFVDTQN